MYKTSLLKSRAIFCFLVCSGLFCLTACQTKQTNNKNRSIIMEKNRADDIKDLDGFLNYAIDRTHRYYLPKYPIKLETYESQVFALKNFEVKHQYFSEFRPLVGVVTDNPDDLDSVKDLLLHVHKNVLDPKQRQITTYEIMTKIIAYRNLQIGQNIPLPILGAFNKPKLKMYTVDQIFDLDDGMPAFVLLPKGRSKLPPILLFRGTNIKNSASVMADLDLDGPGHSIFLKNREKLRAWAVNVGKKYAKPRVMGYSLGGSFTQYMCLYENAVINSDPKHYHIVFNQPGVSQDLVDKWYQMSKKNKPTLIGYINEGDLVSTVGQLIGDVNELSLDTLLDPIAAHVTFMTAQSFLYSYKLDLTMKFDKSVADSLEFNHHIKQLLRK